MEEIWKDIEGYEGIYRVSTLGRIRSLDRTVECKYKNGLVYYKNLKGRIIKPAKGTSGYLGVGLARGGKVKSKMVHRFVAKAFIPIIKGKEEVNHINGDKHDNRVSNLEWVTPSENHIHAVKAGLHVSGKTDKRSKKVVQKTLEGSVLRYFWGTREASRETGIPQSMISDCCRGRMKKTKGYIFEFVT